MIVVQMILVIIAVWLLLRKYLISLKGAGRELVKSTDEPTFAVLIPAKDESAVIEGLLSSLDNQSYKINKNDIYVIVEFKKRKQSSC